MEKLYEITLNEGVAEAVMVYLSEQCEEDTPLVYKFADCVSVVSEDDNAVVTVKLTADEVAEVLNAIIVLENLK